MINLESFVANPFLDREISLTELSSFAMQNLSAMEQGNVEGAFTSRISATRAALGALEGASSEGHVRQGAQQGKVWAKKKFRRELAEELERIHGAVAARFGAKSAEMKLVFPRGRGAVVKCRDEELNNQLDSMVGGVTGLAGELGAGVLQRATGLAGTWTSLYAAAGAAKAARREKAEELRVCRQALAGELFRNVLTVGLLFPNQPERMRFYCRQELLKNRARREGEVSQQPG